jgi:hypothetical protein
MFETCFILLSLFSMNVLHNTNCQAMKILIHSEDDLDTIHFNVIASTIQKRLIQTSEADAKLAPVNMGP